MKYRWDNRYLRWGLTAFFVIAASMLFYYGIFHMKSLLGGIQRFLTITAPIIHGFAIAYVLSAIVNYLENSLIYPLMKKKEILPDQRWKRVIRWVCVISSLIFLLFIIYGLIMMVLPQLIRSVMNVIYSFPELADQTEKWVNNLLEKNKYLDKETLQTLDTYSEQLQNYLTTTILPQLQDMLKNISSGFFDILIFLKNFLIGMIISAYLLADKEKFIAKAKRILYAAISVEKANFLIRSMQFTHQIFSRFFSGKILDSAIIGVLCYILMTILNMPYAILISVIVGVTNVIPFFGPYLGAIPCFLLILLVEPLKSFYFLIMLLALQQFDGNILGPKILGESTGLSSFMVIVAILLGGGLFGVPGMLVGVPVAAVIYAGVEKLLVLFLNKKELPSQEDSYIEMDILDPETKKALPRRKEPEAKPEDSRLIKANTLLMKLLVFLQALLKKILAFLLVWGKKVLHGIQNGWRKFCKGTGRFFHKITEKIRNFFQKFRKKS